jgi:hypothetical protein
MLNNKEFYQWCKQLGLSREACDLLMKVRNSEPARLTRGRGNSVIGQYPSQKMGRTIQFESHRCELSFIHVMEHNSDVLEIWDQPAKLRLTYKANSGRKVTVEHTPDFLICWNRYAEFVECKTEEELIRLAKDSPGRFCKGANGEWHCPPGEESTNPLGIRYTVHSSATINPTYVRNIEFLDDYFRESAVEVSEEARQIIQSIVKAQPGITLAELLKKVLEVKS